MLVDYLLRVVDKSGSPFSLTRIVARVLDPDFVPSERYAGLLAGEIPAKKRLQVCRELFARRAEVDIKNIKLFFNALLPQMSSEDNSDLCELLSEELRETNDEETIMFVIGAFPPTMWPQLDELARLRIENKLIASVRVGKYAKGRCIAGAFGTWIRDIIPVLTLKHQFWGTVFRKLDKESEEQDYALEYFTGLVQGQYEKPPLLLAEIVKEKLEAGDVRFKALAESWKEEQFDGSKSNGPWAVPFADALERFTERLATYVGNGRADEDIPF